MSDEAFPSTTLKILVNDWLKLREIIATITQTRKQKVQKKTEEENKNVLVSDIAIHDAFYGPYHEFIQTLSQAYALISKLRTYLIITNDENIKPHVRNTEMGLPDGLKVQVNAAALDKIQRQLDDLAQSHFTQLQECITAWQQQLIMQITMNEVNLSDIEIETLSQLEPLSELINNFTDLRLALPKPVDERYSFNEFLRAKTILCLHSALSRQHEPHTLEDVEKKLKHLKADFKHIDQEEKKLLKILTKETHNTIKQLM